MKDHLQATSPRAGSHCTAADLLWGRGAVRALLSALFLTSAAAPASAWAESFQGQCALKLDVGGSGQPAAGLLTLDALNSEWRALLSLDGHPAVLRRESVSVAAAEVVLSFSSGAERLTLRLQPDGTGLRGEAQWGEGAWGPATCTPITPPPAVLPGTALRPLLDGLPEVEETTLLPLGAYDPPPRPAPRLSEDGAVVWWVAASPPTLWVGAVDGDGQDAHPVARVPSGATWWLPTPTGEAVLVGSPSGLLRIGADSGVALLSAAVGRVRWVEPRWSEGRMVVAHTRDGLHVDEISLEDGGLTPRFFHPTADDVVLDPGWGVRFLLTRERVSGGRGLWADRVTVTDERGQTLGRLRQVTWIVDRDPVPHIGAGPVHLLGGGELATLGQLGPEGFSALPADGAWADATSLAIHPTTGEIDAVGWYADRMRWTARTPAGAELDWLQEALGADVQVLQRVAADQRWLVRAFSGSSHLRYWVLDRSQRTLQEVGEPLRGPAMQPVEAAVLSARDGHTLTAYITRPDPERAGPGPWPTVVSVHGGPWGMRHMWMVDREAQAWAERGYATLTVNFRGSAGFGWALSHSREATFGGKMIADVEDAIQWATARGVIDPERIAMVGASYGGYAALRFATAEAPLLRCAVGGLVRGNLTVPGGGLNIYSVRTARWRRRHSPDRFTDRLSAPVLVWTGGQDGKNADAITDFVARAAAQEKPVAWIRFPWEAHGLQAPANQIAQEVIQDRFLGACLGGPAWPLPAALSDADLEVRAGVSMVPGLSEWVR